MKVEKIKRGNVVLCCCCFQWQADSAGKLERFGLDTDFWEVNAKCEIVGSFLAVVLQRKTTTKDNWIELSAEKIPS